jgi:carboxypeptidase Taq
MRLGLLSLLSRSAAAGAAVTCIAAFPTPSPLGARGGLGDVTRRPLVTAASCTAAAPAPAPAPDHDAVYKSLKTKLQEIERLEGVSALMGWDEAVMLPENSDTARNNQRAALAGVIFEKKTAAELGADISALRKDARFSCPGRGAAAGVSAFDQANLRDAARSYDVEIRKSKELAMRVAELEGRGYATWAKARKEDDWNSFVPVLKEIIALKKEVAGITKPDMPVYDAIIDDFERGMESERINEIFTALKSELTPLIAGILASPAHRDYVVPEALRGGAVWEVSKQKALCEEIATAMGFDFTRGRFDESVHPFTGGPHPTDVRITTRYSTDNWLEGVSGTVHEAGHGLYEQGRNKEFDDLPVSHALCMGVHESQSLFWERMIFQSLDFWVWATPIFHKHFPHTKDCTAKDLNNQKQEL